MDNKCFLDIGKHKHRKQLENRFDNLVHSKLVLLLVYMLEYFLEYMHYMNANMFLNKFDHFDKE